MNWPNNRLLSLEDFEKWHFVALDTNVITDFHKPEMNETANKLREIAKNGYRFVLPDICMAEAIDYFDAKKPITPDQWKYMVRNLEKFVWPEFPVLPSRKQLYAILGIKDTPDYQSNFTAGYARNLFKFFCGYDSIKDRESEHRKEMRAEFEKTKQEWRTFIAGIRSDFGAKRDENPQWNDKAVSRKLLEWYGKDLNDAFASDVRLSDRRNLALQYAISLATHQKGQGCFAYNPDSPKNRNDGRDFLILDAIMLGASICSGDNFFINASRFSKDIGGCLGQSLSPCQTLDELMRSLYP